MDRSESRRQFLVGVGAAGASIALTSGIASADDKSQSKGQSKGKGAEAKKEEDVGPTEDLMREHGVLRRVLLIYGEGVRLLSAGSAPKPDVFASAAGIIQRFIEGYHEKLEEEQVFPRMEKAGKLVELTKVLREQHEAGRKLTAEILKNATAAGLANQTQRQALIDAINRFSRMYAPHAAREDTDLFPAFHQLFTPAEFDKLGDQFEEKEHQVLGEAGFEGTVNEVAQLEKALGIFDLGQFTPK
jgi:hemerythrin-like domain-containing protein